MPDATVLDEDRPRQGAVEIRAWQTGAASEFAYTTTVVDSVPLGADRHRITSRLEGNFPGGIAHLHFDFTLADERIAGLEIAP